MPSSGVGGLSYLFPLKKMYTCLLGLIGIEATDNFA